MAARRWVHEPLGKWEVICLPLVHLDGAECVYLVAAAVAAMLLVEAGFLFLVA